MSWEIEEYLQQQAEQTVRRNAYRVAQAWHKCDRCGQPYTLTRLGDQYFSQCYCEVVTTFADYKVIDV